MAKRVLDEELRFSIKIDGNDAQNELIDLERDTRKYTQANKDLRSEKARLIAQGKKETEEYKRVSAEIKQNTAVIKANEVRMKALQNQIGVTGLTFSQLSSRASQLKLQLRNMVPDSGEYKKLAAELSLVNSRMSELRLNATATKTSISGISQGFNRYAALGASVIATLTGMVISIQKVIDINGELSDAQSDVRKTTGLTKEEVDDLTKSFGLMKTRTARIELLQLAEEAGRLGIEGVQNIKDFVEVANQIKVALGDDLGDEQIREVGKMVNIYKVGEKTGRDFKNSLLSLGSAINEVSASGANQAGFLVDYLKRQAGVAAQTRLSAADNIGYAATFDELGQSVEVSATAMNKVWVDMFADTATYAGIAGVSVEDFTQLLNTDANKAMILFLKGLNGNNQGLTIMVDKLKDLDVGGARGTQTLAALASNTDLLEKRQVLANKAMTEAVSLTNEYDLKNNNLAATIEKVRKSLIATFSSETIIKGLSDIIGRFAVLIGAVDNVGEALLKEADASYKSAVANRELADESALLLQEYQDLTADGVEPTTESKKRLEEITLLLRDRLGDSVVSIDKETGALKLNTKAVKEQIEAKLLLADEEAAQTASRFVKSQKKKKELEAEQKLLEDEYKIRKRLFAQSNQDAGNLEGKTPEEIARISAAQKKSQEEFRASQQKIFQKAQEIAGVEKLRLSYQEKLKSLNYTPEDAEKYFAEKEPVTTNDDTVTPTTPSVITPVSGKEKDTAKKRAEDLLKLEREAEDDRLKLLQEGFHKEQLLEEINHYRKLEDLENRLVSQKIIEDATNENLKASYLANNANINSQIESELELHELRKSTIFEKGIQNDIEIKQSQYERERIARETAHNNEMAALGDNERAKEKLQKEFDKKELQYKKSHLEILVAEVKKVLDSSEFEGFDIKLLTPEQLQSIKDRLGELGLSISEINALLAKMQGKNDGLDFGSEVDVLGFSIDQWEGTFEKLESLEEKIRAGEMAVGAFMNAWGMYNKFVSANQQKELQQFERATEIKKEKQKRLLDSGLINQRQYDTAIRALEDAAEKKRLETEYRSAKREKSMNIASILMNTAVGVSKALAQGGFVLGVPWAGIVAALGAIQLGMAVAQPLPAKGYEQGFYPVQREQDGKMFNAAFGGESRTGMVNKPTVFLAGEGGRNFPEMIIDGRSFKQMNPDVKQALYSELARVKGFEGGYNQTQTKPVEFSPSGSTSTSDPLLIATLNRTNQLLDAIEKDGFIAVIDPNLRNMKKLQEELDKFNKLKLKNKR